MPTNLSTEELKLLQDLKTLLITQHQLHERGDRALLEAPCMAVDTAIVHWMEQNMQMAYHPIFLEDALQKLPASWLERITTSTPTYCDTVWHSTWQDALRTCAPGARMLPRATFNLDNDALDDLIAFGFRYDVLVSAEDAAHLWLTRGARFGERSFRAEFPRKSPVIAYWSKERARLYPKAGLHPDGVKEMASEIRKLADKRLPDSVGKKRSASLYKDEWRVALALIIHNVSLPFRMEINGHRTTALGTEYGPRVKAVFAPATSAHHTLAQVNLKAALPDLETLLSLPADTDVSYLDPYLPKLSAVA